MKRKRYIELQQADRPERHRKSGSIHLMAVLVTTALLLAGCGDNSTDPMGGGNNGGGNGGGNEIGTEPTFTNVLQIFQDNCGGCHIGNAQNGVQLDSYQNVTTSVGDVYGTEVVNPGNPDQSPLVDKIEPSPENGQRMPQGGPYLSDERINQIRQWIADGANND